VTADILAAVVRTTRFGPFACGAALSVLVLTVPIMLRAELDFLDATLTLHLAMVAMLTGTAFVLDDPAQPLTEVLPVSARHVSAVRMVVALVAVTACWAVLLWLAPMTVSSAAAYPRAGLIVEPYALLAWTWASAGFTGSRRGGRGSALAAPALLVLSVLPALLPDSVAFYVSPGAPGFAESRLRWTAFLVTGLAALLVASSSESRAGWATMRHIGRPRSDS
jgi:hypothetical protein